MLLGVIRGWNEAEEGSVAISGRKSGENEKYDKERRLDKENGTR